MCGRYDLNQSPQMLMLYFSLGAEPEPFSNPDVRATNRAPIIRNLEGQRVAGLARWGLIGSCADVSLSSDGQGKFLVGCQILHEEFGLGTVRAINVDTRHCLIQLDRRDVTIDCSLAELAGKGGNSTIYVKRAEQAS